MPKRIKTKPGDIIEIPIDGYFGYAMLLENCGYRLYSIKTSRRATVEEVCSSGCFNLVNAGEWKSETGEWPIIGRMHLNADEKWPPACRYLNPGSTTQYTVSDRDIVRPARPEDSNLPIQVRVGEEGLVDIFRKHWGLPTSPNKTVNPPARQIESINGSPDLKSRINHQLEYCGEEIRPYLQAEIHRLYERLEDLPESASDEKNKAIREFVVQLNAYDSKHELMESVERDVVCDLLKEIGKSAGLKRVANLVNRYREW